MDIKKKNDLRIRRHRRVRSRVSGTAARPRLVVFRSLHHIYAQLIDDQTGRTLVAARDTASSGNKTEKARGVGETIAAAAIQLKISTVVFDRNGYQYHGRIKALAEAARQAGLKF